MALFRGHKPLISECPTPPCGFVYDVFLSFRGEDTRKNFTDHLYTALVNAGVHTFRDNIQLERGENIKEELEKAIQQSRGSVIVFSKHYTSSKWCLEELVMILERRRTSHHVVLPVFYDVCPSEVRQLAESLAKVPKYRDDQSSEKLNGWRAALLEVADLAGMVLQNEADRHEAKFIQKIVGVIQTKLPSPVPLSHVQKELEDKLLSVGPVLYDAEGKQLKFQTSVKPWLHKLKEAVYEAEDLLQEIKTEVLRQKMEPESGSSTSKVQEILNSPPFNAFGSALIHRKVDEVLNRLDNIMEKRRDVLGMEASAGYTVAQTLPSTSLVEEHVYGRDEVKETLIKLLLSDDGSGNKISVISIVGMGGMGKTTLAQFMYNDVAVKQHFDLRGWACVSKEFDVLRISQHLYESLTLKSCKIMNLALLQLKLQEILMGKRFILVLDDIWNKNYTEWDVLRRPFLFGEHGSKIIITTRNQDVASMVCTLEAHRLKPMSEEDGWLLFEKHAFKNAGVGAHSHLEAIGRKIVRKCKGLPLAIKSLGGLLCSELIVGEWESILNSDIWDLPQEESGILPSLWLSYKDLPPHLRRCFAHCSVFPKNYTFSTSELVYLWMGEDLLQPRKNKTAQEIGQDYFNDLVSRSFFQLSTYFNKYSMHDLINDLASFVSGEFCLRWESSDSPNILSKTRHFSYPDRHDDGDDRRKMFEALKEANCLRTFLPLPTMQSSKLRKVPYEVLSKLQSLRALKLSGQTIEELPDSINNLKHLRHLDLSWTAIRELPDTICTLYNLQVLLLSLCSRLTELPADLGRLINLSHLDNSETGLQKMPPCMGNLKNLQMLEEYVLDKETAEDNLPELKKLQNLRGRLRISGLVHSSCLEAYILRDKKFLEELILVWGGLRREETGVLEKFQPHLNLKKLTIEGYGGQVFPGWSAYYFSSALVYLKLEDCENIITLPPLGQLPSLADLHIEGLHRVVSIGSEFYYGVGNTTSCCVNKPFRSLRSIRLQHMGGLKEWCYVGVDDNEGGIFLRLVELYILHCPSLTLRLALDSFPMLKVVRLGETDISLVSMSPDSELLSLNELALSSYANIATFFDGGLHAPNLKTVQISGCEKLSSWPGQMPSLFPSLVCLSVKHCRELEPFPEGGFPSKLESLTIQGCKKVNAKSMQNLKKGLRRLTSLKRLSFGFDSDEKADWFAAEDEGLVHSTLIHLDIRRLSTETIDGAKWFGHLNSLRTLIITLCPALRCLPESGLPSSLKTLFIHHCAALQCLSECGIPTSLEVLLISVCPAFLCLPKNELPTSLKTLRIMNCPALECFPDCGLPTSLVRLVIKNCPLLHKRCQRGTGEDWPKIAHIPLIEQMMAESDNVGRARM